MPLMEYWILLVLGFIISPAMGWLAYTLIKSNSLFGGICGWIIAAVSSFFLFGALLVWGSFLLSGLKCHLQEKRKIRSERTQGEVSLRQPLQGRVQRDGDFADRHPHRNPVLHPPAGDGADYQGDGRMNKIRTVVQKLALLTMTVLPLASLADHVTYERVMVPVFNLPEWLLWGSVVSGFAVVSVLMFVAMRRNGRPSMEFVMLETVIAAALTCLLVLFKGFFYEERVIHHLPNHRYGPEKIQVKCRECGKEYTTTVTHYGGGTQSHDIGLCNECRSSATINADKFQRERDIDLQ